MTLQYRWYLKNADSDVAERYLLAAQEAIRVISEWPGSGRQRKFLAPELAHIRSIPLECPFGSHLLFYVESDVLRIERIIHGARDLPKRLMGDPEE